MSISAEVKARPVPLITWRFPSAEIITNQKLERGVSVLIWAAMPFTLYLLSLHPGGFGGLVFNHPEYFFLAAVAIMVATIFIFVVAWGIATKTVPVKGVSEEANKKARDHQRYVCRAWVAAVIPTFAVTAILLSISIRVANYWYLPPGSKPLTIDFLSQLVRYNFHYSGDLLQWLTGYLHAFVAVVVISFVALRWPSKASSEETAKREPIPLLNLLSVSVVAYLMLCFALFLTTLDLPKF